MLQTLLTDAFKTGDLTVVFPGGMTRRYGDGTGPQVEVALTRRAIRRIGLSLSLGLEMLPSSSGSASKCSIRLTRSCSTSLPYEQGDDDGGVCV